MRKIYILIVIALLIAIFSIIELGLLFTPAFPAVDSDNHSNNYTDISGINSTLPSELIKTVIKTDSRNISVNATVRIYPSTLPVYWAEVRENDALSEYFDDGKHSRNNVTSIEDAPETAKKIFESYGGLPNDAKVVWSDSDYSVHHSNSGE